MSAITAIMDELAATLEAVVGTSTLGDDGAQVVGRLNLNPTGVVSIDIYPDDPFRRHTEAGFGEIDGAMLFVVRARIAGADLDGGQDALLNLMDDESPLCVAAALEDDQTLNGLASAVVAEESSGYRTYGDNPGAMLGVQWRVAVLNLSS